MSNRTIARVTPGAWPPYGIRAPRPSEACRPSVASNEARLLQANKGHRKVLSKTVHSRSLSSIHILYNHDPVQALYVVLTSWPMHAIDNFQLTGGSTVEFYSRTMRVLVQTVKPIVTVKQRQRSSERPTATPPTPPTTPSAGDSAGCCRCHHESGSCSHMVAAVYDHLSHRLSARRTGKHCIACGRIALARRSSFVSRNSRLGLGVGAHVCKAVEAAACCRERLEHHFQKV